MKAYPEAIFNARHAKTIYSANTILSILLERIPEIGSAIDIGCGVGTWLSVLQGKGIQEIKGLDGKWVDPNLLVIPRACFEQVDLRKTIKLHDRYDLAISLEVAEHLPPDRAEEFVFLLTELSDFVLFSAAIPFQGGRHHLNEQWQHYWVKLFGALDYDVYDFIRPKIWKDTQIPYWYKQNILFFCKRQKSVDIGLDPPILPSSLLPLDVVHPDLYLEVNTRPEAYINKYIKRGFWFLRLSFRKLRK
jgi:hypothetical protein